MDVYLWPLVSCYLYMKFIRQKKKDFGEIEKNFFKYSQKNISIRIVYNPFLCIVVYGPIRDC